MAPFAGTAKLGLFILEVYSSCDRLYNNNVVFVINKLNLATHMSEYHRLNITAVISSNKGSLVCHEIFLKIVLPEFISNIFRCSAFSVCRD